jgi:hypothetical protein
MQLRKVQQKARGPYNRSFYIKEWFCEYCEWKGITGPGAQLRNAIQGGC